MEENREPSGNPASFFLWIKDGFGLLRKAPGAVIGGILILCLVEGGIEAMVVFPHGDVVGMILSLLFTPAYVGWMILCLKAYRGENPAITDLFGVYAKFAPLMAAFILYLLMVIGGSLLFLAPGFILATKFMFAGLAVADRNLNVAGAFRFSDSIARGHKWKLFALLVLSAAPGIALMIFAQLNEYRVLETPWHPYYNFASGFASGLLFNPPMGLFYATAYENLWKRHEALVAVPTATAAPDA